MSLNVDVHSGGGFAFLERICSMNRNLQACFRMKLASIVEGKSLGLEFVRRWGGMRCAVLLFVLGIGVGLGPVAGAASILGTVRFEGRGAPVMKPIDMSGGGQCHAYYDEPPLSETVVIGEAGAMKNVFVHVVGGLPSARYYGPMMPAVLNQEACMFSPRVLGIRTHQTLQVRNSDVLIHNVNASPDEARAFNVSMPPGKKAFEHVFGRAEFPIKINCDAHEHMRAYIGVFYHPFFSVTGEQGAYEISGLDAGTYEIEVWQELWAERLGAMRFTVTLEEGESKRLDIVYTAGKQPKARLR